jgi:hypothetical protein
VVSIRWIAPLVGRAYYCPQLVLRGIVLAPFGLAARPDRLTLAAFTLVAISAMGSAFGNLLLARPIQPHQALLPLIYAQLIPATILGFLVLSDWPDWLVSRVLR